MTQTLLFLTFSGLALIALIAADCFKKVSFKSLIGLFLSGIFMSTPFIMVEYLGGHMKYYFVILAFILIELTILYLEHHIKYFHDLMHHNIKDLRYFSFLLIGLGFTYSEISFTILEHQGTVSALLGILPFKILYALTIHTILTSAASLTQIGNQFAESIYETMIKLMSYYSRITLISISHFLYAFSLEHNFILLIGGMLSASFLAFYYLKKQVDLSPEAIE
jgi:hypothetical protein